MTTALLNKLAGVKDLKQILETTVREISGTFVAESCQIALSNPLDPNVTSICEYKVPAEDADGQMSLTLPLALNGLSFGSLTIARRNKVSESELNSLRIIVGELGNIICQAQISDIIQRDTFRDTFLVEIGNVMSYSLGIGDALFMVVNILGKALKASRCLFICTDEGQTGWKCYEFWQADKVRSAQEYCWPTTDSPVIAQTLLSTRPLLFFEGQADAYASPVQEELLLTGVRSLLGIALTSNEGVHGCVVVQQCDYRRAWTRKEVDMVQSVADKVAEALVKLPAEKRKREPIMQLHQRIVPSKIGDEEKDSVEFLRNALKGALGQRTIPSARALPPSPLAKSAVPAATPPPQAPPTPVPTPVPKSGTHGTKPGSILKTVFDLDAKDKSEKVMPESLPTNEAPLAAQVQPSTPYSIIDLAEEEQAASSLESTTQANPPPVTPPPSSDATAHLEQGKDKVEIPDVSTWGNLDAIPTPMSGPAKAGLGAAILSKGKSASSGSRPLGLFAKDRNSASNKTKEVVEFIEGPPMEIDETEAKEKLKHILSSSNPTSDYIFATAGLDPRMLGRIDGWVSEIEQKDKYANGHARQVAEYSCLIGEALGLNEEDMNTLRQAALVHDLGKLGIAQQILQKKDEELSDAELLVIMKHPLTGAELLANFPDLVHLADIVRSHHEEYDGNGYPQGLKGEEIPLAARIIYLANSYHGMISEMCYGPGMSPKDAQEQLKTGVNKQYDATLVQILIHYLEQQVSK